VAEATNQQQLAEQIRDHLDLFKRGVPYYDLAQPEKKIEP